MGYSPPSALLCLQVPMAREAQLILKWFYRQEADGSQLPRGGSCQCPVTPMCHPQQHSPQVPAQILQGVNPSYK